MNELVEDPSLAFYQWMKSQNFSTPDTEMFFFNEWRKVVEKLSPVRPASADIFISVDHRGQRKQQRKRITTTLNTRRGNKSLRKAIWRWRTIITDGAFINGGMRERGPLTPPPSPLIQIGSAVLRGPSWWLRAGQTRPFESRWRIVKAETATRYNGPHAR